MLISPRLQQLIDAAGISVASYNLGCFSGAITAIWIGDILGRHKTIFLGSSIMIIGAALQCSALWLGSFSCRESDCWVSETAFITRKLS